ncbi:alpha/beta hydrolase [Mycobacterium sp. AMU20-3851]|uniref:alpha/beta hydrolase n=1 Tax=Mycobacterium sp. AMU20-3851 TaxID=3122055 RepID=UPI003753F236
MRNRFAMPLGAATTLAAISAALLSGAATATADPGGGSASEAAGASTAQADDARGDSPAPDGPADTGSAGTAETDGVDVDDDGAGAPEPEAEVADVHPAEQTLAPRRVRSAVTAGRARTRSAAAPAAPQRIQIETVEGGAAIAHRAAAAAELQPDAEGAAEPTAEPVAAPATASKLVAVAPATTVRRSATLIAPVHKFVNAVGSTLLNALMGLIQFFAGPPVLPPRSTVTVRTSSLVIPVGAGRTVQADWYFPDGDEPATRLIYLQHGFGAVSSMYSYSAAALAERTNSVVVAPTLTSNFLDARAVWLGGTPMQDAVAQLFAGERTALTESASAAAGHAVNLPTRFALVGHSLGATLVLGAAGRMADNGAIEDLVGVVLLDGVDVNDTAPAALDKLTGVAVRNISSERYQWNRYGLLSDQLQTARPGQFNGVMLEGGRHIDGLQGGNPLLQFAEYLFAGFSQQRNVEAVRTLASGWINDMFAGTAAGIYPAPGAPAQIPTSGNAAVAVALPIRSTTPVRVTPWDGVLAVILDAIVRVAVYEPPNTLVAQSVAAGDHRW